MAIKPLRLLVPAAAAAVLLFRFFFGPAGPEAEVTAVYDGDTIKVRFHAGQSEVVRLIGVDAPELRDSRGREQFPALMSKRFAFISLYGEGVKLEYDREGRDRYGRLLAYVRTRRGLFNETIIRRGFASAYLKYPFRDDYRLRFSRAEKEAREQGRGLWRSAPYPLIAAEDAAAYLGSLMRVSFVCRLAEARGRFVFLSAASSDFSALIERGERDRFPPDENLVGRGLTVTGLVEEYRGRPQLLLFLPSQLAHPHDDLDRSAVVFSAFWEFSEDRPAR